MHKDMVIMKILISLVLTN